MKKKVVLTIILSAFNIMFLNAMEFERIYVIPDTEFSPFSSVFFYSDSTIGVLQAETVRMFDLQTGKITSRCRISTGFSGKVYNHIDQIHEYFDEDAPYKDHGRLLFHEESKTILGGQYMALYAIYDPITGEIIALEHVGEDVIPESNYFVIGKFWINNYTIKKDQWTLSPKGVYEFKEKGLYSTAKDRGQIQPMIENVNFVAQDTTGKNRVEVGNAFIQSTWTGQGIMLDFSRMLSIARNKNFFESNVVISNEIQAMEYIQNKFGSDRYKFYQDRFPSGFYHGSIIVDKPSNLPSDLILIDLENRKSVPTNLPYYTIWNDTHAFDVNPKGNLLVFAEQDPVANSFKHWSVYRIILDAQLMSDRVRLRAEPSVRSKILASLDTGTKVKLLDYSAQKETINDQEAYWFKVRLANKTEGWVFGAFLESDECKLLSGFKK